MTAINFMHFTSSEDNGEEYVTHSKTDNIEIKSHDEADEATEQRFESIVSRYRTDLETSVKSSDFIFHCFNLLSYKYRKINLNHGILI